MKPWTDFCATRRETRRLASFFKVRWRIRASTNYAWSQSGQASQAIKSPMEHGPSALSHQRGSRLLTWLAWGAATNKTGPCLGTFQEPLGWTSRKKRSTKMDMNQRKVSYFLLLMG